MKTTRLCPNCAAPLPPDAPAGLCPVCLLKTDPTVKPAAENAPPSLSDIAQHFPQLEILELIGQGGMGIVYKARQPKLDRIIALKILPAEAGREAAFAERFAREARTLAKLNHPGIVAIYDFGSAGPYYYLIMEFVDGVNLRQMMQVQQIKPAEALGLVMQICEALQFAHDRGVVHRDIKPGNILADRSGHVKIADFGLAKLLGQSVPDFTLTGSHHVMGTPHYMAPEQASHPQQVDHRADIYSLGVVFYEMLTGELPMGRFPLPSQKVQADVRLDEIVLHTLERDVERRYQHASDVRTAVENVTSTPQPAGAASSPRPQRTPFADSGRANLPAEEVIAAGRVAVQGPADAMVLVACAALLTALGVGIWLWTRWDAGVVTTNTRFGLFAMSVTHAVHALFMVTAGILMRRLWARLFTLLCVVIVGLFVPAGLALNVIMELRNIPEWPVAIPIWLGMPVALWATIVLFRRDGRAAFKSASVARHASGVARVDAARSRNQHARPGSADRG